MSDIKDIKFIDSIDVYIFVNYSIYQKLKIIKKQVGNICKNFLVFKKILHFFV